MTNKLTFFPLESPFKSLICNIFFFLFICYAGHGNRAVLPWEVRFKVAVAVAEALNYLHKECPKPVIHRDVKSSNILLSNEFQPQVLLL